MGTKDRRAKSQVLNLDIHASPEVQGWNRGRHNQRPTSGTIDGAPNPATLVVQRGPAMSFNMILCVNVLSY